MSQRFAFSIVIIESGRYTVSAKRLDDDLLSIYVNRVKKVWDDTGRPAIMDQLDLQKDDVIESTGELEISKVG